ncbi:hypothetical protein TIFTF001_021707 [Ficus carica]|uniref:Uncharacterized protein n=1 Tax=Ficus carica TaxID=3494 RepID=A0AA88AV50_FICCA|nr:hypothetical protein TIFTF001_021707 [Ficus carica]
MLKQYGKEAGPTADTQNPFGGNTAGPTQANKPAREEKARRGHAPLWSRRASVGEGIGGAVWVQLCMRV